MTTHYKPEIVPLIERQKLIEERRIEATKTGKSRREYKFRNGEDLLPIITVPLDLPIYRLANYRTRDQQLSLIATGKVASDLFDEGHAEDPLTQRQQHEILVEKARTGSGETIKPIYAELARVAKQTEDLIISADGVVVNGNRRLSAMRELYVSDPDKYKLFAEVTCAVLPPTASKRDILELEIGLQMQPETKLPYEWTALGRAVRDLRDEGLTDERIAALMNRDKADVMGAAKMIDSADIYLGQWLDRPNNYGLLEGTEQAFKQIAQKNLGRTDDPEIREVTRQFDFYIVEGRGYLTDRAYTRINAIESNPELFLETFAKEYDIPLEKAKPSDVVGISFGEAVVGKDYTPLLALLDESRPGVSEEKARTLIQVIEQVCAVVIEQSKGKEHAALEAVRRARKTLVSVDLANAAVGDYAEIEAVLEGCTQMIDKLRGELAQRKEH